MYLWGTASITYVFVQLMYLHVWVKFDFNIEIIGENNIYNSFYICNHKIIKLYQIYIFLLKRYFNPKILL